MPWRLCLKAKGLATSVGDEGGFAPDLASDEEAIRVYSGSSAEERDMNREGILCWPWTLLPASGRERERESISFRSAARNSPPQELVDHWKKLV